MPKQSSILTSVLCLILALCSLLLFYRSVPHPVPKFNEDDHNIYDYGPMIAISLGHTHSRVAFTFKNGTTRIIPNAQGHNVTPNYFAFNESNYLIGEEAKARAGREFSHGHVISGFTKYIGHDFKSMKKQSAVGKQYIVNRGGVPKYRIHPPFDGVVEYSPTNLTGFLLRSLRQDAERYLGQEVKDAVIAFEDGFTDEMRNDIKEAGKIAGLSIRVILKRSVSVAMAYDVDLRYDLDRILVYHLGSSYAEASVVEAEDGVFQILGFSRDTHESLTAHNINQNVVGFIVDELNPFYALDPVEKGLKLSDLKYEAEQVQRTLSCKDGVEIKDRGKSVTFSRSKFEQLIDDDLTRTLAHVDKALAESKMSRPYIDAILLSGGSANIPKVKSMLKEYLGIPIIERKDFNPEEAALFGASRQARFIMDTPPIEGQVLAINELALGIEMMGGFVEHLVKRGEINPLSRSRLLTTVIDNQTKAVVKVFEGLRPFAKHAKLIATLTLNDIPPAPAGEVDIKVTFSVDLGGLLTVTALCRQTGRSEIISVNTTQSRIQSTHEQIKRMIEEDNKHGADDYAMRAEIKRLAKGGKLVRKDGELRELIVNERLVHQEL